MFLFFLKWIKLLAGALRDRRGRFIRTLMITSALFYGLTFFYDRQWAMAHLELVNLLYLQEVGVLKGVSRVLSSLLGLDLTQDNLQLILLALLVCCLLFICCLVLFSAYLAFLGFSFLGSQLWKIWTNYQWGKEVLYQIPFMKEPFLLRRWTPEEKLELLNSKVEILGQTYQCPSSIIDKSALLEEMKHIDRLESLEKFIEDKFQEAFSVYTQSLEASVAAPSSSSTFYDVLTSVYNFCSDPVVLTGAAAVLCLIATATVYYVLTRTPPPPANVSPPDVLPSPPVNVNPQDLLPNPPMTQLVEKIEDLTARIDVLTTQQATLYEQFRVVKGRSIINREVLLTMGNHLEKLDKRLTNLKSHTDNHLESLSELWVWRDETEAFLRAFRNHFRRR